MNTHKKIDALINSIHEQNRLNADTPVAQNFIAGVEQQAKNFCDTFKRSAYFKLTPIQEARLDDWVHSANGQAQTSEFVDGVLYCIDQLAPHGLPGHDARHMIIKTPLTALRFLHEERMGGYRSYALLAAVLHDIGRIFEPALFGKPQGGVMGHHHPIFSFIIAQELFALLPPIPQQLKEHVLFALVSHQQGNFTPVIAQIVQRSDREQLIGSEGIARFFAFDVGLHHQHISVERRTLREHTLPLPGTPEDTEVFHHAEFYLRNLYECIGAKTQPRIESLKSISATFLWLASSEEIRAQIFAPEFFREQNKPYEEHHHKPPLSKQVWHNIERTYYASPKINLKEQVYALVSAPASTVTQPEIDSIDEQLVRMNAREKKALSLALHYVLEKRAEYDTADQQLVRSVLDTYPQQSIEYRIAEFILSKKTTVA